MFKQIIHSIFLLALCFQVVSCSSSDKKDGETPEVLFAKAQELEKEERYEESIRKYQDVKNKFPYSKLATQAELAIADVHYKEESFPEAQATYQVFKELHPKHAQIDYVTHKLGMSYFNQLPSTIDRDLTIANQAIQTFDELIKNYPNSTHIKEAQEKRKAAFQMIAEKEVYIANFYFKKEHWQSAFHRYLETAKKYSGLGFDETSLHQAKLAAEKAGKPEQKSVFENLKIEKKATP